MKILLLAFESLRIASTTWRANILNEYMNSKEFRLEEAANFVDEGVDV